MLNFFTLSLAKLFQWPLDGISKKFIIDETISHHLKRREVNNNFIFPSFHER
jgi:hypothetical protein